MIPTIWSSFALVSRLQRTIVPSNHCQGTGAVLSLSSEWLFGQFHLTTTVKQPDVGITVTPAQLKRELRRIAWGHARLAQKLGVWPTEVREWLAGKEPVPEVVASDIRN